MECQYSVPKGHLSSLVNKNDKISISHLFVFHVYHLLSWLSIETKIKNYKRYLKISLHKVCSRGGTFKYMISLVILLSNLQRITRKKKLIKRIRLNFCVWFSVTLCRSTTFIFKRRWFAFTKALHVEAISRN